MDTVIRASSFENISKKILIPFNTKDIIKKNLIKKKYIIHSFYGVNSDMVLIAKKKFFTHIYINNKIKKI
jgi:hypothetical protein